MSTPSLRRLKERGGGNVAAPPTGKASPVARKPVSTGKENPVPTPRSRSETQKPQIRHMARIDKSAAALPAEEPRSRWSSLSVPKGRSSSPSQLTNVLSDLRKNPSRVPLGPTQGKRNGVNLKRLTEITGKNTNLQKRVSTEMDTRVQEKERVKSSAVEIAKKSEELEDDFLGNEKNNNELLDGSSDRKEKSMNSISEKKSSHGEMSCLVSDFASSQVSEIKPCRDVVLSGLHSKESEIVSQVSNSQGSVTLKENAAKKHPSKLQEKLAFLEGKVKKIASDLNRTKEILDSNNPDASKIILSDIQEKIIGIEKTMVHVGSATANKEKTEEREVVRPKISIKSLSAEELEARLFPHHKLLRHRTLLKTTSRGFEDLNEKKVSSLYENEIASEFLASLSKESKSQEADEGTTYAAESEPHNAWNNRKGNIDALLMADENLYEFDDQEIEQAVAFDEAQEMNSTYKLMEIGCKTSTGGWFVSEGESVILAHDDGSCSFYDIANSEIKAEYKPPKGIIPHAWQDCWIIRAPNADGSSGRYVIAATKGDSVGAGFCSWDFYSKDISASHFDDQTTSVRTSLAPLSNYTTHGRYTALSTFTATEKQQWWYKPCGPLLTSAASCQRRVRIYDIRDGEQVMEWELEKPVMAMDYAAPLHWRNRGKVVIAQTNGISLWDVNSLTSQALMSVSSSGSRISALHVNNTDAELGGGIRQRLSSQEAEGNDGVFCTHDSINVLDFRHPSGIALKIPKLDPANVYSAFSHGDSVYVGCSSLKTASKNHSSSQIQEFSLRSQRLLSTYALPEPNAHHNHHSTMLTQVWGNSSRVIGVCGLGLFVFDSVKDKGLVSFNMDCSSSEDVKEVIGADDMCCPSFDYLDSRILLISNDRPAQWRYLL